MLDVELIAFDSMGVRSMATLVQTPDASVMIDPGVALGPSRYHLPPHRVEVERLREKAAEVAEAARSADVVVVTHYHYDHHDLGGKIPLDVYDGKVLLAKHPTENINRSQREERAPLFLRAVGGRVDRVEFADGRTFEFGGTRVRFSRAVFHGTNPRLGYVVEVAVESGGEVFLFSSDVEGPSLPDQLEFMLEVNPNLVVVDGPMTYMLGFRYSRRSLEESVTNLIRLLEGTRVETLVLDHHLTRDLAWRERVRGVLDAGAALGKRVESAASFMGVPEELLEARRRELYSGTGGRPAQDPGS